MDNIPRYYWACPEGHQKAVIRSVEHANDPLACGQCRKPMSRAPRGATSKITETLDNGLMSRRVERPADVERLNYERSRTTEDDLRKP